MKKILRGISLFLISAAMICGCFFFVGDKQTDIPTSVVDEEVEDHATPLGYWEKYWNDDDFDGYEEIDPFDKDIAVSGSTVTIKTGTGLAYFASCVNSGEGYYGEGTDYASATVTLGANIDISKHYWSPIGTAARPFKGTFNGNGHKISGVHILTEVENDPSHYAGFGLFGVVQGATIRNFTIAGGSATHETAYDMYNNVEDSDVIACIGSAVGLAIDTKKTTPLNGSLPYISKTTTISISNVHVSGFNFSYKHTNNSDNQNENTVNNADAVLIGGVVGGSMGDKDSITNCSFIDGKLTYNAKYIASKGASNVYRFAGLVGETAGSVTNCFSNMQLAITFASLQWTDSIGSDDDLTVGVAGIATHVDKNCTSNVFSGDISVSVAKQENGITYINVTASGIVKSSAGVISKCVNYGDIIVNGYYASHVAGVCNYTTVSDQQIFQCANFGNISVNCTFAQEYFGDPSVGGILGCSGGFKIPTSYTIENCLNYGKITIRNTTKATFIGVGGILGYTMKDSGSLIHFCINGGEITGYRCPTGGIVGKLSSGSGATVSNCVNYSKVQAYLESGDKLYFGQIVGYKESSSATVKNCFINSGVETYCSFFGKNSPTGNTSNNTSNTVTTINHQEFLFNTAKFASSTWKFSPLPIYYYDETFKTSMGGRDWAPVLSCAVGTIEIVAQCTDEGSYLSRIPADQEPANLSSFNYIPGAVPKTKWVEHTQPAACKTVEYLKGADYYGIGNLQERRQSHLMKISIKIEYTFSSVEVCEVQKHYTFKEETIYRKLNPVGLSKVNKWDGNYYLNFTKFFDTDDDRVCLALVFKGLSAPEPDPEPETGSLVYLYDEEIKNDDKFVQKDVGTVTSKIQTDGPMGKQTYSITFTATPKLGYGFLGVFSSSLVKSEDLKFNYDREYIYNSGKNVDEEAMNYTGTDSAELAKDNINTLGPITATILYSSGFPEILYFVFEPIKYQISRNTIESSAFEDTYPEGVNPTAGGNRRRLVETHEIDPLNWQAVGSDFLSFGYAYTFYHIPKSGVPVKMAAKFQGVTGELAKGESGYYIDLTNYKPGADDLLKLLNGNLKTEELAIAVVRYLVKQDIQFIELSNNYNHYDEYKASNPGGGDFGATYTDPISVETKGIFSLSALPGWLPLEEAYVAKPSEANLLDGTNVFSSVYAKENTDKEFSVKDIIIAYFDRYFDTMSATEKRGVLDGNGVQYHINSYHLFQLQKYTLKLSSTFSTLTMSTNETQEQKNFSGGDFDVAYYAKVTLTAKNVSGYEFDGFYLYKWDFENDTYTGKRMCLTMDNTFEFENNQNSIANPGYGYNNYNMRYLSRTDGKDCFYIVASYDSASAITAEAPPNNAFVYTITKPEHLAWVSAQCAAGENFSGKIFRQTKDIDFAGKRFVAIGNETTPFKGYYDGNNYLIKNLNIGKATSQCQGLFGVTDGATIKNLTLVGGKVSGKEELGGIVGRALNTTLEYVNNFSCEINSNGVVVYNIYGEKTSGGEGTGESIGGLAGKITSCTINKSSSRATISAKGTNINGFVGLASSGSNSISESYCDASVEGIVSVERSASVSYFNVFDAESLQLYGATLTNGESYTGKYAAGTTKLSSDYWFIIGAKPVLKVFYWC